MERHEIPTHLDVADRAVLGLTMRQFLVGAIGMAIAYGALNDLPVPLALRLAVSATVIVVSAVLVFWHPGGRSAEEWAFVLLRYGTTPRVAVWRHDGRTPAAVVMHEVLLPPVGPARAAEREEAAHVA